jgi:hypothetical protein
VRAIRFNGKVSDQGTLFFSAEFAGDVALVKLGFNATGQVESKMAHPQDPVNGMPIRVV